MNSAPTENRATAGHDAGVRFHYTFDDYHEAHLVVAQRERRENARARDALAVSTRSPRHRVARFIYAGLIGLLMTSLLVFRDRLPDFLIPRPNEYYLARLFLPVALFFVIDWAVRRLEYRAIYPGRSLERRPGEFRSIIIRTIAVAAIGVVTVARSVLHASANGSTDDLLHDGVALGAPWLIIFLIMIDQRVKPWRQVGGMVKNNWDAAESWRSEKTALLDDETFWLGDEWARYELSWRGLSCEEGDNVFVLISKTGVFYVLPKRILTGEQIAFLRDRYALGPQQRPTSGFPVLPPRDE